MDSAMIAAIVSVLGAGFLAMLFFFMRGIRADIADLRTEMRAEIRSLRADMQTEFAAVRADMQTELAAVRSEMQGMRSDIAALQQTVACHDGILSQIGRQNGTAA